MSSLLFFAEVHALPVLELGCECALSPLVLAVARAYFGST